MYLLVRYPCSVFYDPSGIAGINNLDDAIEHYQNRFYKLDNAIRHLYKKFLADESILKPIQEYYQQKHIVVS